MAFVDCNGVRLHTQTLGQGPLLVMCHGLVLGSLATWYFSAAAALAQRHRVLLFDQRGHGKSAWPATGYDPQTLSEDLAALIDLHSPAPDQKVLLVGHSYGALAALRYALNHPERVEKLVLVDAPLPASQYVYPSLQGIATVDALLERFPPLLQQQLEQGSRSVRRLRERLEFLLLHSSLVADVANAVDIPDEQLAALKLPVLCVYGRHSDCLAAGERLARVLPDARLQVLECGHYVPVEVPEAMTNALLDFLAP